MISKPHGFRRNVISNPFSLIVLLLVAVYVGGPFVSLLGRWGDLLLVCVAVYALRLAVYATKPGRWTLGASNVLGLLVVAAAALHDGTREEAWALLSRLGFAVLATIALIVVLRLVLTAREVGGEEIFAAIAAYLLLGSVWSHLYVALYVSGAAAPAFSGLEGIEPAEAYSRLAYYSYVTMTTLGYGDIVPANSYARSLATFEAITGQLFVAILLARLVALQTNRSLAKPEDDG